MSLMLLHELWDYHRWANRTLFDVAAGLGEELAGRDVGKQFSVPYVAGMLYHIYESDRVWLQRWKGDMTSQPNDDVVMTLAELRPLWDALEGEQRSFIGSLGDGDLSRVLELRRDGVIVSRTLGALLLHVPNHATHHRSEIATMLTMLSGSPPDTGINSYYREKQKEGR